MDLDIEWIESLEKPFRQNHYNGDINSESYFKTIKGNIPILISVPHATNHVSRKGEWKTSDSYTGAIGLLLHQLTGCHLIYLTKQAGRNPNGEWISDYREELKRIIREEHIQLVIDLHGMSRKKEHNIDIGTNWGRSITPNSLDLIKTILAKYNIPGIKENFIFKAEYPTINFLCTYLNTESIQMEIHKQYREPKQSFEKFSDLIHALCEIIQVFSGEKALGDS